METGKEFAKGKQREYAPGQHGQSRKKMSDYGLHLYEKQKLKYLYGMNERQFRNTFKKVSKLKGITGTNFLIALESRLDNLVYRLGFARSRRQARQLVNHNHFLLDGKKANIPSMLVKVGQSVEVKPTSQKMAIIEEATEARQPASWLSRHKLVGKYDRLPERSEISRDINESLVVEYYSK